MKTDIAIVGCGSIGSALGKRLVLERERSGAIGEIVATTTTESRLAELRRIGLTPALVEVADVDSLRGAVGSCELVYLTVAAGRRSASYRDVYLRGIENLLAATVDTPLRRVIYTSSTSVYGQSDGSWVDETSATEPGTETGRVLLEAERALFAGAEARDIDATVLRLAGIYGPDRGPQRRLERLAGQRRDDGDAYLNLIHSDDVVEALLRLRTICHHGVLNLSDGRPVRRRDYYDRLLAENGLEPILWTESPGPAGAGRRIDSSRAAELLGLRFRRR